MGGEVYDSLIQSGCPVPDEKFKPNRLQTRLPSSASLGQALGASAPDFRLPTARTGGEGRQLAVLQLRVRAPAGVQAGVQARP